MLPAPALFISAALFQYIGAAIAVGLFGVLDPGAVVWWRIIIGGMGMLLIWRPWRVRWNPRSLGASILFGLALAGTNLLDDERSIPFFQPDRERFLEFDLTRLVYELSNPRRPVVGVMSSLPLNGDPRMMMMMRGGPAPRFVKKYADLRGDLAKAAQAYAAEVRDGSFPAAEHSFEE